MPLPTLHRLLAITASLLASATPAQALEALPPIDVASYSGTDGGPRGYYGYDDNTYSGTRSSSGVLSGGEGDLTDGTRNVAVGSGYWNWSPYVLWDGVSPVLTFDLGARHAVVSIVGFFNYYPRAAVYIPPSAQIRFSDDGVHFGAAQQRLFSAGEQEPGSNDSTPSYELLTSAGQGRYVELTLTTPGRWIALSEVAFSGSPSAVPEPGAWLLMASGLGTLAALRTRQRRRQPA